MSRADRLAELTFALAHEDDPIRRAGIRATIKRLSASLPEEPAEVSGSTRAGILQPHGPRRPPPHGSPWGSARLARLLGTPDPLDHDESEEQ